MLNIHISTHVREIERTFLSLSFFFFLSSSLHTPFHSFVFFSPLFLCIFMVNKELIMLPKRMIECYPVSLWYLLYFCCIFFLFGLVQMSNVFSVLHRVMWNVNLLYYTSLCEGMAVTLSHASKHMSIRLLKSLTSSIRSIQRPFLFLFLYMNLLSLR